MVLFTILGTTIQDGGIKERSDVMTFTFLIIILILNDNCND